MKKISTSKNIIWVFRTFDKSVLSTVILFLLHTVLSVSMICIALVLRQILDSAKNYNKMGFKNACVFLVVIIVLRILFATLCRYLDEFLNSKVEINFRYKMFSMLMYKDYAMVTEIHNAEWMNRLVTDTNTVAGGLTGLIPNFGAVCIKIIAAMISLMLINEEFVYIIIASLILLSVVTVLSRSSLKEYHNDIRKKDGKSRIYMQERLDNFIIVKAFGAEHSSIEGLTSLLCDFRDSRLKRNRISVLCYTIFSLISFGLYAYGAISCGKGIFDGTMSAGDFTAAIALISQFIAPIGTISSFIPKYYAMSASAQRLRNIESLADDNTELIFDKDKAEAKYSNFDSLNFKNVSFSFGSSDEVISNFSFKLNKGDFVALCGKSGSGKSTTLRLMMSVLLPKSGEIYFEGINGVEKLTSEYRKLFSYVPQDNMIISGTVREILCLGLNEHLYDDDKLVDALKVACAYDFVFSCNDGLDTIVGENGKTFSYGEMQRLAIARAILSDRKILLLDEVTSALDEETEITVLNNIRHLEDKTVVLVSHRRTATEMCNMTVRIGNNEKNCSI